MSTGHRQTTLPGVATGEQCPVCGERTTRGISMPEHLRRRCSKVDEYRRKLDEEYQP